MQELTGVTQACDVCYRKRIRCDAQKPRCSHCILYDSVCTFQASSRKARHRKQQSGDGAEALRTRVESLESSLDQALQRINTIEGKHDLSLSSVLFSDVQSDPVNVVQTRWSRDISMELPPLQEIFCAVEKYFVTLNSILPLFHRERLLQSISRWHACLDQRDLTTWATINMLLALAHRQPSSDQATPSENASHYIRNAQSVLAEVILGDINLLTVQYLVGMTIIFQGVQNLKPASMLIAIALRLAHELGLHTQASSMDLDNSAKLERNRVFWIAYILDRDISMRTKQPPVQHETDIQVEWPSADPEEDGAGFVAITDGGSDFNFFLSRVQLAQIQGEIYEAMHLMNAQNWDRNQQLSKITELGQKLDDWTFRVPQNCRPKMILQASEANLRRSFGVLFASHLACRAAICQAHVMEKRWLQTLQDHGRRALRDGPVALAPLPPGWQNFVNESREYMGLFESVDRKDPAFVW